MADILQAAQQQINDAASTASSTPPVDPPQSNPSRLGGRTPLVGSAMGAPEPPPPTPPAEKKDEKGKSLPTIGFSDKPVENPEPLQSPPLPVAPPDPNPSPPTPVFPPKSPATDTIIDAPVAKPPLTSALLSDTTPLSPGTAKSSSDYIPSPTVTSANGGPSPIPYIPPPPDTPGSLPAPMVVPPPPKKSGGKGIVIAILLLLAAAIPAGVFFLGQPGNITLPFTKACTSCPGGTCPDGWSYGPDNCSPQTGNATESACDQRAREACANHQGGPGSCDSQYNRCSNRRADCGFNHGSNQNPPGGDCNSCGGANQGQCGVGNSDTCFCNDGNAACDPGNEDNGAGGCRATSQPPGPVNCAGAGQNCTPGGSGASACCTGQNLVCQSPRGGGQTVCQVATPNQCPGGTCTGYIGFRCNNLTNGECHNNPQDFTSWGAATGYADGCGQADQVCIGGERNRQLCGDFQIFNSSCGGGGGETPTPTLAQPPPECADGTKFKIYDANGSLIATSTTTGGLTSLNRPLQKGETVILATDRTSNADHAQFRLQGVACTTQAGTTEWCRSDPADNTTTEFRKRITVPANYGGQSGVFEADLCDANGQCQ